MMRLKLLLAALSCLLPLCAPAIAAADTNDFTVTSFVSDETLTNNDPQGELHIVEHIGVNFTDQNHGLLRAIPKRYKNHELQLHVNSVSSPSGAPAEYTTYGSNGNTVLKIGDKDETITGAQQYLIDYTLRNVISFYPDHDELYWNVNGAGWDQRFDNVSVALHTPQSLAVTMQPVCYSGPQGSTAHNCVALDNANEIDASTTQSLSGGENLSYVVGFKKSYFHASSWHDTLGEYQARLLQFLTPLVVIGGAGLLFWLLRGRDPKGTGIIVPQYDAPDNLKPLAVGVLCDLSADNRDITATIIDLAIRKYIKISETTTKRKLRKDKVSYSLELLNADYAALDVNEKALLAALFPQGTVGKSIYLGSAKTKLYEASNKLKKDVTQQLQTLGYIRTKPLKLPSVRNFIYPLFILSCIAGAAIHLAALAGVILGGIIAFTALKFSGSRTAQGVAANEHIQGLKRYLDVAEKDRLNKLQSPTAAYANAGAEPVKTVELFEKLLPYAIVLGVEKGWAKQYESLYNTPPDWYDSNWQTFNAYYLASSLTNGIGGAVNTSFAAPASSSSSGFGGGFSGGGGGGGGGGGW